MVKRWYVAYALFFLREGCELFEAVRNYLLLIYANNTREQLRCGARGLRGSMIISQPTQIATFTRSGFRVQIGLTMGSVSSVCLSVFGRVCIALRLYSAIMSNISLGDGYEAAPVDSLYSNPSHCGQINTSCDFFAHLREQKNCNTVSCLFVG